MNRFAKPLVSRVTGALALALCGSTLVRAGIVYFDDFQSYPVQSPAPNPLTNGPAGGQWYFVDPTPPTIGANDHRIFNTTATGSGMQSRCWISSANDATITNAISLPALPPGTNVAVITVSFLAATDTSTAGRTVTFRYAIGSSGGSLGFIAGGNADLTQSFTGLNGYGTAPEGTTGKSDNRKFSVRVFATNITTADKIFLSLTRVTNSAAAGAFIAIDDVGVDVLLGLPEFLVQPQSVTTNAGSAVVFSAIATNFPNGFQWTRNGEPVPGANASTYTIPFVTKPDEGSYVLWATNTEGVASSAPAVLTVSDSVAPTLAQASGVLTLQHIRVRFSEPVDPETATNALNYTLTGAAAISAARMADRFTVELTTSELTPATLYTVTVNNVKDLANLTIAAGSTVELTTPVLVLSPVRYDAGTSVTRPAGPEDPASAAGGYWNLTPNTNLGLSASAVIDDEGTGFHAWKMSDATIATGSGVIDYRMPIDQPSDSLARSNGWRFVVRSRMVIDGPSACPVVLYSDPGNTRRYGMVFDVDSNGNLTAGLLGGQTYVLTLDAYAYHTHTLVFDPATTNASYYFDGQLVAAAYLGDANTAYNGVAFGTGSTGGTGEMNFNLVQLDVIGGTRPVLLSSPQSSTNGVGQKATFTAQFTPFVGAYQWLSNGVIIPGATSNSFTTEFLTMGMSGQSYRCRALHALGHVESAEALLIVTSDTNAPTIVSSRGSLLLDRVSISFSEPVLPQYATNLANYVWGNSGITNVSARLVDPLTVELRTGPQQADSNYTVRVSNVRDTSNLIIANNTPATFKTAKLQLLARYDAGTTVTRPNGPPDPGTPEGGSWLVNIGSDPGLVTNAVVDDFVTGFHAWQVADQTAGVSQFIQFNKPLTSEQQTAARANGWVMSVRSRFADDFGSSFAVMCQVGDQAGNRHLLWFDLVDGNLAVRPQGGADHVLMADGTGSFGYHLHQVVFDPGTTNAAYYFDGELILSGWGGDLSVNTYPGVQWGSGSSANMGNMNFNLVEVLAVEPPTLPSVTVGLNAGNIEVKYVGILEATTTLETGWAAVATNATTAPVTFTLPAAGTPQQFFRARAAQ